MSDQISIEEHQKAVDDAVKDALTGHRLNILESGILAIQSDIKEHGIQSKINSDNLQKAISDGLHGAEQRSIACQQDLKEEFYTHLSTKYATKEYVDGSVKYMKLAAIIGAVSFLATVIGVTVIVQKLGGM